MEQDFFDFLKSDRRIITFDYNEDGKAMVSKVKCNDKIEILYALKDRKGELFDLSSPFKYIGIYNKENNKLYDIDFFIFHYDLKFYSINKEILTKDDLYKIIEKEVNEEIRNFVNSNIGIILDIYKSPSDIELQEKDVLYYFINGISSKSLEDSYTQYCTDEPKKIISYLTDKDTFLKEEAKDYIFSHVDSIVRGIYIDAKKRKLLKEIENNKEHPYHKMKEIIDILKDNNFITVNVTINKNGIEQTFKYNANKLKENYILTYLSCSGFEKKNERDLFEKNYGRWENFNYEDIKKITYGKKVIYEDENLKEKEMEMEL